VSKEVGSLSEEERMAGIAEILCRAIQASDLSVREGGDRPPGNSLESHSPRVEKSVQSSSDEDRVIRYLRQVGEASPAALRTFLRLPRTSAFRVLNRLSDSGQIVSEGQTRSLVYRLGALPAHRQNPELN
jgi:uncharacterized membrane protein